MNTQSMRSPNRLSFIGRIISGADEMNGFGLRLQGRCSRRICYSPKQTRSGDRAYGALILDTAILADEILRRISPPEFDHNHSADVRLFKWLRDHDRSNSDITHLNVDLPIYEAGIEQAFLDGSARMFCTCCNRNYRRSEIMAVLAGLGNDSMYRYYCPKGHLLMAFDAGQSITQEVTSSEMTVRCEAAA